jgi:nitrous oxidase accessory protein NosD
VVTGNSLRNAGGLGAGSDAVQISDENNLVLSANILEAPSRYGILLTGITGCSNIDILGNEIRASGSESIINLIACTRLVCSNNVISANVAGNGINFTAAALTDSVMKGNQLSAIAGHGIRLTAAVRVNAQDNKIACAGSGVYLTTCSYCTITGNGVDSSGSTPAFIDGCSDLVLNANRFTTAVNVDAIYLPNANIRIVINGNKLISAAGGGVNAANLDYSIIRSNQITGIAVGITLAAGCDNNVVSGNEIISPTSNGITNSGQYNNINGNRIVGSGNHGIQTTSGDCLIGGNHVTGCAGDGIRLDGTGGAILRINCNGNYVSGCTGDGIHLIDCDESMVQGNRSYGNTGWGINQDAASDQDLVSSNHVRGNTAGALQLLGTNLTNVNNKV